MVHRQDLEDGKFYKIVEGDNYIIVFSAIPTFMKRNPYFSAVRVIFYDYSFRVKSFTYLRGVCH